MKNRKSARLFWRILKGKTSPGDRDRALSEEMKEMTRLWRELDAVTPPIGSRDAKGLEKALDLEKRSFFPTQRIHPIPLFPRLGAAAALLLMGVAIGHFFLPRNGGAAVSRMAGELHQVRRMMMFSLLNRESPSERMRAVRYLRDEAASDFRVKTELLKVLNSDPNVTVRLESLYALAPAAASHPDLRRGLATSLLRQESPLMQISLVDLLRELDDPSASASFRKLLERRDLSLPVRDRVRGGLSHWL